MVEVEDRLEGDRGREALRGGFDMWGFENVPWGP